MSSGVTRRFKVSAHIAPHHGTFNAMRDAWRTADEMGADSIFTYDHFFPAVGNSSGPVFEAWSSLAAMAEVTTRARIGCLVTAAAFRNPDLLAHMTMTIDHASHGRLILGLGAGWIEKDFTEYGYDYGTASSRMDALEEAVPVIRDRLDKINPGPVNGMIPILIGGGGEKRTLRLVAEHADSWHYFGNLETGIRKAAVLDEWARRVGRDPADIERAIDVPVDEIAAIDEYAAAGFTHFTVVSHGPDWDLEPLRQLIVWRDSRG